MLQSFTSGRDTKRRLNRYFQANPKGRHSRWGTDRLPLHEINGLSTAKDGNANVWRYSVIGTMYLSFGPTIIAWKMDSTLHNHRLGRLSPNRLAPYQAAGIGMLFAFCVLLIPGLVEETLFPARTVEQLRIVHLIRGFIATTTGMLFVWWIMHRKEVELVNLRDHCRERIQTPTTQVEEAVRVGKRQINDLDLLQRALADQREDFLLALQLRLKTPVRANGVAVRDLIGGEYGEVTAMQKEVLSLMAESNQDIERLVGMLVSLYRYRNGKFNLQRTLCTVENLFPAYPDLQERANRKNILIDNRLSPSLVCKCDPEEIRRLLYHLLDNAVKHASSTVILSSNTSENYLEIVVTDDGQGISSQDFERLFDRFHYVTASGVYAPVTGIGLCLCAEIARAHGGSLVCRSEPGNGANFILTLPLPGTDGTANRSL